LAAWQKGLKCHFYDDHDHMSLVQLPPSVPHRLRCCVLGIRHFMIFFA